MRTWLRRRRRWRMAMLATVIIISLLVVARYGILFAGHWIGERWPVSSGPVVVRNTTELVWLTHFRGCGDQDQRTASPDGVQVGLTRAELSAVTIDWTISSFTQDRIVLERALEFCDRHRLNRFLVLNGDTLRIHRGTDATGPVERELPGFTTGGLGDDERTRLLRGLAFSAVDEATLQEDIDAYLEGIIE